MESSVPDVLSETVELSVSDVFSATEEVSVVDGALPEDPSVLDEFSPIETPSVVE